MGRVSQTAPGKEIQLDQIFILKSILFIYY